jgi:hypothetical protein
VSRAPDPLDVGRLRDAAVLPGFVARWEGRLVGLVTFAAGVPAWEVVTLDSLLPGRGVGAVDEARRLELEIHATGLDGILIGHELELELRLGGGRAPAAADTWHIEREEAR